MSRVDSISELPRGDKYVYHLASSRKEHDILIEGIKSSPSVGRWMRLNKFLQIVHDHEDIDSGPEERSMCVFCYSSFEDMAERYDEDMVFALDLEKVSKTKYSANHMLATKIDKILSTKDSMRVEDVFKSRVVDSKSKEAYQMALDYWNTLSEVSESSGVDGEVLIDGDLDSNAIESYTR